MALAAADPALAARVSPDLPDLVAEAAFAARREQVLSLADVLLRRTRLGLLDARALSAPGAEGAVRAARAMAGGARLERRAGARPSCAAGARWRAPRGSCPAPRRGPEAPEEAA